MDRYEYFGALKYYLRGISKKEVDQIIEEFKSHFAEAELNGKTDEETIDSLGDPKVIAAEILEEYDVEDNSVTSNSSRGFGKLITNLINKMTKSPIVIDLSDNDIVGKEVDGNDVFTYPYNNVVIKLKLSGVNVKTVENESAISERADFSYKIANDTLYVVEGNKDSTINSLSTVYLPDRQFDSFFVKSSVGQLNIDKINAKEVVLENNVGALTVKALNADDLNLKVRTGEAVVEDLTVKNLKASVATGDLEINGLNNDADVNVSVALGAAKVRYRTRPTDVRVDLTKSSMGSVDTNGLFKKKDIIGNGTNSIKGKVSLGDLEFDL